MRKLVFCIRKDKAPDQLHDNHAADQNLCIHYIDSTTPLLPKSEISSLKSSSVALQPCFCRSWLENLKTGFLVMWLTLIYLACSNLSTDNYTLIYLACSTLSTDNYTLIYLACSTLFSDNYTLIYLACSTLSTDNYSLIYLACSTLSTDNYTLIYLACSTLSTDNYSLIYLACSTLSADNYSLIYLACSTLSTDNYTLIYLALLSHHTAVRFCSNPVYMGISLKQKYPSS